MTDFESRSPHGERGLKLGLAHLMFGDACRSPPGERGLKCGCELFLLPLPVSLPARGAWVEIYYKQGRKAYPTSRSPHGERGLKFDLPQYDGRRSCRAPQGERGLK